MTYSKEREPYQWLNEHSKTFLNGGYLKDNQTPVDRIAKIALHAERLLHVKGYAAKFEDYMSRGWFSLSSPIWSNFGTERGLPISCFGSYIEDSVGGISYANSEVDMMSKMGGGASGYFGHLRSRGKSISGNGESNGSFPFARKFDTSIDVISQGTTRRGQFAGYIDIEHGDINEWLEIQLEGNPIQLMYYGVCVGKQWLKEMKEGDKAKRKIWAKLIQVRGEIGAPYILFKDNANDNTVDVYKDKDMKIYASNLCSEIMLPSNPEESFVCCLSSMNLVYYDEWKDTDAVEVMTFFLDAVMTEFIEKLVTYKYSNSREDQYVWYFMQRTYNFALRHRALGMGVIGWHSLLQSKNLPFEGFDAMQLNNQIFSNLKEKAYAASEKLAELYGKPEVLKGYGRRNTTLLAIAPTKSSAFIMGQASLGIEPFQSNIYVKDLAKIKTTFKNPYLEKVLEAHGKNNRKTWLSILKKDGSVQHLDFLTEHEKNVFKTFREISQLTIIQQAAQRQKYICQGQSLNLTIDPRTPTKDVNALYLEAAELGVKSLYYQNNINAAQEFKRNLMECSSCDG